MSSQHLFSLIPNKPEPVKREIPHSNPYLIPFFDNPNFTSTVLIEFFIILAGYSLASKLFRKFSENSVVKAGLSLLEPFDLEMQDEIDSLANSIREISKADRVTVSFLHNGEYNSIMHFKKYTVMSESFKKGLMPIKQDNQGIMIGDFLTQEDLLMYKTHKADTKFVEVTSDSPCFSAKRKAALIGLGISRSLDRFLVDEATDKAFGFISLQYYSPSQRDCWLSCLTTPAQALPKQIAEEIEQHITMLHSFISSNIKNSNRDKLRRFFGSIFKYLVTMLYKPC